MEKENKNFRDELKNDLQNTLKELQEETIKIRKANADFLQTLTVEDVIEKEVTTFGNSAHVAIPIRHLGKRAVVHILRDNKKEGGKNKN